MKRHAHQDKPDSVLGSIVVMAILVAALYGLILTYGALSVPVR